MPPRPGQNSVFYDVDCVAVITVEGHQIPIENFRSYRPRGATLVCPHCGAAWALVTVYYFDREETHRAPYEATLRRCFECGDGSLEGRITGDAMYRDPPWELVRYELMNEQRHYERNKKEPLP